MTDRDSYGPAIFYASDKNIYDALLQHKVDMNTIRKMFNERNIIVSKNTKKEFLAKYFSRLHHDYFDQLNIANKLGVVPRREKLTSLDIKGDICEDAVQEALEKFKVYISENEGVVDVNFFEGVTRLTIQYKEIDYSRSELNQVVTKDGIIELIRNNNGMLIRSSHNDNIDNMRDMFVKNLINENENELHREEVSLESVLDSDLRNEFFLKVKDSISGFECINVKELWVARNFVEDDDEPYAKKISLKGESVNNSYIMRELRREQSVKRYYHIFKMAWEIQKRNKDGILVGNVYFIEALFSNYQNCTGFSFVLRGVYEENGGILCEKRRAPSSKEIQNISLLMEDASREISSKIIDEFHLIK